MSVHQGRVFPGEGTVPGKWRLGKREELAVELGGPAKSQRGAGCGVHTFNSTTLDFGSSLVTK